MSITLKRTDSEAKKYYDKCICLDEINDVKLEISGREIVPQLIKENYYSAALKLLEKGYKCLHKDNLWDNFDIIVDALSIQIVDDKVQEITMYLCNEILELPLGDIYNLAGEFNKKYFLINDEIVNDYMVYVRENLTQLWEIAENIRNNNEFHELGISANACNNNSSQETESWDLTENNINVGDLYLTEDKVNYEDRDSAENKVDVEDLDSAKGNINVGDLYLTEDKVNYEERDSAEDKANYEDRDSSENKVDVKGMNSAEYQNTADNYFTRFMYFRKFLREYDRVSLFIKDDGICDNYRFAQDIPDEYDVLYVVGITMGEEAFSALEGCSREDMKDSQDRYYTAHCIKFILSYVPA